MQVLARIIAATWTAATLAAAAQPSYQWTDITPTLGGSSDLPHVQVTDVAIQVLDGTRLVIVGSFHPDALGTAPANGVMYSADAGRTWSFPASPSPPYGSLFANVARPGVVYVSEGGRFAGFIIPNSTEGRLYRSDDFGRTWSLVSVTAQASETIKPIAPDPLVPHGLYAIYSHVVPAVPACLIHFCADTIKGITRTSNEGFDWSAPIAASAQNFFVEGPTASAPARVFVGSTSSGSSVSTDGGSTWLPFATTLATPLRWVRQDPLRANVLYGGQLYRDTPISSHSLVLRSDDSGSSWREIFNSPTADPTLLIDPAHSNTLWLIDFERDSFFRSDSRGETWQSVPFPIPRSAPNYSWPSALVVSPAQPGVIYVAQYGRLFRGVPVTVPDPVVVEYQYEGERYWLTSLDGEAVSQDYRQHPGDVHRTGLRWGAWRAGDAPNGALGSCRFWSRPESGLRTRVLVLQGFECDNLKRDPNWILEGENEFYALALVNGACAAGLVPVRRFNNLKPDLNHRWVADEAVAADMRARGWYDEGVRFCARPLGSNE